MNVTTLNDGKETTKGHRRGPAGTTVQRTHTLDSAERDKVTKHKKLHMLLGHDEDLKFAPKINLVNFNFFLKSYTTRSCVENLQVIYCNNKNVVKKSFLDRIVIRQRYIR